MSLQVSAELVEKARKGHISDPEFIACIKNSLPDAWQIVERLAERKQKGEGGIVKHAPRSMDEKTRGQLLRMMASDAMRRAIDRYFGMTFAFQNCHATAVFNKNEMQEYARFSSVESQILNQSAELRDC